MAKIKIDDLINTLKKMNVTADSAMKCSFPEYTGKEIIKLYANLLKEEGRTLYIEELFDNDPYLYNPLSENFEKRIPEEKPEPGHKFDWVTDPNKFKSLKDLYTYSRANYLDDDGFAIIGEITSTDEEGRTITGTIRVPESGSLLEITYLYNGVMIAGLKGCASNQEDLEAMMITMSKSVFHMIIDEDEDNKEDEYDYFI